MTTFRHDINALRALAIISVLGFHFRIARFDGGFGGVDVFFVVSGFLMTSIVWNGLQTGSFSLLGFYRARATRIIPALLFLCLALLVFGSLWFDPIRYADLGREVSSALLFFSNVSFFLQADYFGGDANEKILLHTWSLSVEWQFYLVYPIFLMVLFRYARTQAGILTAIFTVLSFSFAVGLARWKSDFDFYMLPSRAWEMGLGGIVYFFEPKLILFSHRRAKLLQPVLAFGGFAAIIGSIFLIDSSFPWPAWATLAPTLGAAAVIMGNYQSTVFANSLVGYIGRSSYSIYLWHWPVLSILGYFEWTGIGFWIAAILSVSLMSALSYSFIERFGSRLLTQHNLRAKYIAAFSIVLVISASVATGMSQGWPRRFDGNPDRLAEIARAMSDRKAPENCRRVQDKAGDFRDCQIGEGHKKIMLFGDSFAAQLYPRLAQLANAHADIALHVISVGGCPPLPEVNVTRPDAACLRFTRGAIQEALTGHYDVVAIASIWEPYFRLNATEIDNEHNLCFMSKEACVRPASLVGLNDAFQVTFERLSSFVSALRAQGVKVVLILPTPFAAKNTRDFPLELARREFLRLNVDSLKTLDLADFRDRTARIRSQLFAIAAKTGATLYNPSDELCSLDSCPILGADGIPVYTDSAHLRASYIERAPMPIFDRDIMPSDIAVN